ncbi:MAG: bioA, partial [Glaciihabitans sp.]|nr:bioA [Glaciihabitans sp.]
MTTTEQPVSLSPASAAEEELQRKAKDHLWMHFARQSVMEDGAGVPIIVKGKGHHIWDSKGKQYFDGLSGLFVVNAGHGRKRLAEAAAKQA